MALDSSRLLGRGIVFAFARKNRCGTYAGLIRRVVVSRDRARQITAQLVGGNPLATSRSARFRGEVVRLNAAEMASARIAFRGAFRGLDGSRIPG